MIDTTSEARSSGISREASRRRTFAIISHPDAGKTTLTEKLLLYGGAVQLAGSMDAVLPSHVDLLGGLEMGGIPIVTALSARTGLPALFVRKKAKEYGTCKLAEGPGVAGRRITLVEDVITTGGAVRDATDALRAAGAKVDVVVCAIDRSPDGQNPLADVGLEVRPVLTKVELDAARAAAS